MSPPSDYPLDADATSDSARAPGGEPWHTEHRSDGAFTVAVLFERHRARLPITDAMIADACRTLRAAESVLEN